jgi:hypothetical protein
MTLIEMLSPPFPRTDAVKCYLGYELRVVSLSVLTLTNNAALV